MTIPTRLILGAPEAFSAHCYTGCAAEIDRLSPRNTPDISRSPEDARLPQAFWAAQNIRCGRKVRTPPAESLRYPPTRARRGGVGGGGGYVAGRSARTRRSSRSQETLHLAVCQQKSAMIPDRLAPKEIPGRSGNALEKPVVRPAARPLDLQGRCSNGVCGMGRQDVEDERSRADTHRVEEPSNIPNSSVGDETTDDHFFFFLPRR